MIELPNPYDRPVLRWVAVIGSRGFPEREACVRQVVQSYADGNTGIVTGTLPDWSKPRERWGVDEWAVIHALSASMTVRVHPIEPGQGTFGQRAAARNQLIARDAFAVEALWDGASRGTRMTLRFFRDLGKPWSITYADRRRFSEDWWDAVSKPMRGTPPAQD